MDTAEHARRLIRLKDGRIISDEAMRNRRIAGDNGEISEKNKE